MTWPLATEIRSEPAADLCDAGPSVLRYDADATIRTGESSTPRGDLSIFLG